MKVCLIILTVICIAEFNDGKPEQCFITDAKAEMQWIRHPQLEKLNIFGPVILQCLDEGEKTWSEAVKCKDKKYEKAKKDCENENNTSKPQILSCASKKLNLDTFNKIKLELNQLVVDDEEKKEAIEDALDECEYTDNIRYCIKQQLKKTCIEMAEESKKRDKDKKKGKDGDRDRSKDGDRDRSKDGDRDRSKDGDRSYDKDRKGKNGDNKNEKRRD